MKEPKTECHNRVSKYVTNGDYEQFRDRLSLHSQLPAESYRVKDIILRGKEQKNSRSQNYTEKYIIRSQNNSENGMLLIKETSLGAKIKESILPISADTAAHILEGSTKWLCASISPFLRELGVKMTTSAFSPDTVLNFVRECFTITGKLKITADSNISISDSLCSAGAPLEPLDSNIKLLQINYDRIIPEYITSIFNM